MNHARPRRLKPQESDLQGLGIRPSGVGYQTICQPATEPGPVPQGVNLTVPRSVIGCIADTFSPTECANYFAAAGYDPD